MKKIISLSLAAVVVATSAMSALPGVAFAAANPASFSLSQAGARTIGETFAVTVAETGNKINVVTAKLSYDTAKLQYVGIDTSSSSFPVNRTESAAAGVVTIGRYAAEGTSVSDYATIGVVRFKALVAGSARIAITDGSRIVSNETGSAADVWSGNKPETSATISEPVTTPAPSNPTTGDNTSGNTTTNSSTTNSSNKTTSTTASSGNTTAPDGSAAADSGTVADAATTADDISKESDAKSDDKQSDDKAAKDESNGSAWLFWLLAILAIAAGWFAGRRLRTVMAARAAASEATKPAATVEKPAKKRASKN